MRFDEEKIENGIEGKLEENRRLFVDFAIEVSIVFLLVGSFGEAFNEIFLRFLMDFL
jgi:hypothetical protein